MSTCESEYYAMTMGAQDAIWVRRLMDEIGMPVGDEVPTYSDNRSEIVRDTAEKLPTGHSKNIDVRVHFLRDLVKCSEVEVRYVPSEANDAEFLSKPVTRTILVNFNDRLALGSAIEEEC